MRKDGYTAMSGSVLPPEARLRELSAAAAAANHEFNYDEAMRHGREALAHVGLDPTADPGEWDACVAELDPATAASLANATTTLAISLFRRSDYVASLQVAQLEAHLRRHIGDEIGEAFASIGLGWCHHAVGLYQHALAHHSAALDVLERLAPKSIAGPLNGIARVYLDLGQPGLALEYAQRGLEAASASQHALRDTSTALRIVGLAHQQLNDPVAARSALEECFRRSDMYGKRFALLGLGELSLLEGKVDEARQAFEQCLGLKSEFGAQADGQGLIGLGRVHIANGEPASALVPLAHAVEQSTASGAPVDAAAAHRAMADALKSLGRWEEALAHFQQFFELHQQTLMQLSDRRTQLLQVQFDVERMRKDREIDRLRNVELAHAYTDLRQLHEQLEAQAAHLERLSRTDSLTGIPNRRAFEETLAAELLRCRRGGHPFSLLMVDLDDFKRLNDTYTHVIGDSVLRTVAQALVECTREVDLVARLGGEEFVILLPETDAEGALEVANKVLTVVPRKAMDAHRLHVTVSVGAATSEELDDQSTVLMRADTNLYEAKRLGKNRVGA